MSRMFMCTRQIPSRKVNNIHTCDECIGNVSAALGGKDNKKTFELFVFELVKRPKNRFSCLF